MVLLLTSLHSSQQLGQRYFEIERYCEVQCEVLLLLSLGSRSVLYLRSRRFLRLRAGRLFHFG